jgi:hypothetical protein
MIDEIYEIEMNGTTVIREKSKKERKKEKSETKLD